MKDETTGISYFVTKKVGKAIWDYKMIQDGDRVLVAVSGGKDSLSLLRIMKERTKFVPIKYELIACHVDMGFDWVNKGRLVRHFEDTGIPYIISAPGESEKKKKDEPFGCFWCSWTRRKALFATAKKEGCSKIAFGHHMDDVIETLLMNMLFNGEICTMRPYQEMFRGEMAIIRPMAYVEERELERLALRLDLPVVTSRCPHSQTSKRSLVKGMIREAARHGKNVKKNLFRSLQRVRPEYLFGYENIPVIPRLK